MENGVEALKIAASMLIFVLTITITISAFTTAIQALNKIFDMHNDDEYVTAKDENGNEYYLNYINFRHDGGTREVGVETIVPAIYRAYKENYAIYFYKSNGDPLVLYEVKKGEKTIQVSYIDLEQEVYANAEVATANLKELLYGDKCDLDPNGLYNYLQNKTFIENLGEYYMDDVNGETETAEVNKTKKRVIAYVQK